MGKQLFLSLAVAALLLSGCVQVVKNEPAPAAAAAPGAPQPQEPAKTPLKTTLPAPKPASRPAGESLPLDLTQVQHESGGTAPPELPPVGQEGYP